MYACIHVKDECMYTLVKCMYVYISLWLFNFYAEYIMWNTGLDEAQTEINITRKNISNLRYADDTTLSTESEAELKSLLMKVKEEIEKAGLNSTFKKLRLHTRSHHLTTNRCANIGNIGGLFLVLQNHCRWWLQPGNENTLSPQKKIYDKPRQCIKKQRHHFSDKGVYSQNSVFSSSHVWMWVLDHKEGWTLKNWCFGTVVLWGK